MIAPAVAERPRLLRDAPIVAVIRARGKGWLGAVAIEAGLTRNALHGLSTVAWSAADEERIAAAYRAVCARTGMFNTKGKQ